MVIGAGSGMCELTNQSRLDIQKGRGLKETGAFQTDGEQSAATLDRMRKLMCFLSINLITLKISKINLLKSFFHKTTR